MDNPKPKEIKRCCKTCGFWCKEGPNIGLCSCPVPESVMDPFKKWIIGSDGKSCETWKVKEKE